MSPNIFIFTPFWSNLSPFPDPYSVCTDQIYGLEKEWHLINKKNITSVNTCIIFSNILLKTHRWKYQGHHHPPSEQIPSCPFSAVDNIWQSTSYIPGVVSKTTFSLGLSEDNDKTNSCIVSRDKWVMFTMVFCVCSYPENRIKKDCFSWQIQNNALLISFW